MDRVHGCELFDAIAGDASAPGGAMAMAAPLVRRLLSQLFRGLAALQALECTHRDVKPDNVMVSGLETPHAARLTLIDFGYACCATRGARTAWARHGHSMGTSWA